MRLSPIIIILIITLQGPGLNAWSLKCFFQIPREVTDNFSTLFPNAENVQWTKEKSLYRADFIYKNQIVSLTFDADGKMIKGVYEIALDKLPSRIKLHIQKSYKDYKTLIVLEEYLKGKIEYEIELIKGQYHYILRFNSKERLINRYEVERKNCEL